MITESECCIGTPSGRMAVKHVTAQSECFIGTPPDLVAAMLESARGQTEEREARRAAIVALSGDLDKTTVAKQEVAAGAGDQ